jgi:hypothetical protein
MFNPEQRRAVEHGVTGPSPLLISPAPAPARPIEAAVGQKVVGQEPAAKQHHARREEHDDFQRLADVPSPPSICWPITAMAR